MASIPVIQARKIFNHQSHAGSNTLLERVELLVKKYETGLVSPLDIKAQIDPLIEELFNLNDKDLPLAREGLCRLLMVNVEEVQLKIIRHLRILFRLSYLLYDVNNNQSKQLVDLEKQISDILALHVRSFSKELHLTFIDLYQDILKRLWFLPHLLEDRDSYVIIEQNGQQMMRDAERWIVPLLNDTTLPDKLKVVLKSLPRIFQQMRSCTPAIIDKIKQLKSLYSIIVPSAVGDICSKIGDYRGAIAHCLENLELITSLRDRNPDPKAKLILEDAMLVVLNRMGIVYQSLGDYRKAIAYQEKALRIAQAVSHQEGEGRVYGNLGNAYQSLGDYRKAIEYYEKDLQIARKVGDREEEERTNRNLGNAYQSLGDYRKAIEYNAKAIQVAHKLGNKMGKGMAYSGLGNAYDSLGEHRKAIEYHEKDLQIAQELGDREGEGRAYGNLGNAYDSLGDYREAIEYHEKHLKITQELGNRWGEGAAYGNLGAVYRSLGDYWKAIEYHEKHLEISQELGDRGGEGSAYRGLGRACYSLGEYHKAIECHEKALQIVQELGNREGEKMAYSGLGNAYDSLGEHRKAIEYHEKALKMAQELGNRGGEGNAYGNLGNAFYSLEEYHKAIECHEKALQMAQVLGNRNGEGNAFNNLGCTYELLNNLPQAEQHFRHSVSIYSSLQHALGDSHQWKITIFEAQVNAYLGLERVLLKQNKIREALEILDARHARALSKILTKRRSLQPHQADTLMNIDAVLKFVTATKSTYFLYSFNANSGERKRRLSVYVITSSGEIHFKALPFDLLPEDSRAIGKIVSRFPFGRKKGGEVPSSTVPIIAEMEQSFATKGKTGPISPALIKRFKERLKKWYEVFIQPVEQYLPQEKSAPLVIIPDGFLSQLPFAAFLGEKEGKEQYLIENFSLSFAPSLSALSLLNAPSTRSPTQACIVSNPATLDSNLNLEESESHVPKLNALLQAPAEALFTNKKATIEGFKQFAPKARLIHIACHGEAGIEKNPDEFSVFEGLLKFAPDDSHKDGYLHAQEITSFSLAADLVFLDACFSGTGNIQREGSIGPIWCFHAAGASSVIGGLWFVPESKLIIDLIDNFYTHYLSHSMSKSKALHLAMTKAIEQERESPHLWGPLFLSGAN